MRTQTGGARDGLPPSSAVHPVWEPREAAYKACAAAERTSRPNTGTLRECAGSAVTSANSLNSQASQPDQIKFGRSDPLACSFYRTRLLQFKINERLWLCGSRYTADLPTQALGRLSMVVVSFGFIDLSLGRTPEDMLRMYRVPPPLADNQPPLVRAQEVEHVYNDNNNSRYYRSFTRHYLLC